MGGKRETGNPVMVFYNKFLITGIEIFLEELRVIKIYHKKGKEKGNQKRETGNPVMVFYNKFLITGIEIFLEEFVRIFLVEKREGKRERGKTGNK
jgi:hypothetical protein